jgi:hypothetical protein
MADPAYRRNSLPAARQKSPLTEIQFPVGGLDRARGFGQQQQNTTPYVLNCRPYDTFTTRLRGGSRPGLAKAFAQALGSGTRIQMLSFASVLASNGVTTNNLLLAIANGILYYNASGTMTALSGTFNATAHQIRGTQLGTLFYIAEYASQSPQAQDGVIASSNQLSAASVADWTALGIDTGKDYLFIAHSPTFSDAHPELVNEANIFPITTVTSGHLVFSGTMTADTGASWQIGRLPKTWNPATPSVAPVNLFTTLPVPNAFYQTGTVTISGGTVTLAGGTWPANAAGQTLTIPAVSGIGTENYLVSSRTSNSIIHLSDTTTDADRPAGTTYQLSLPTTFYGLPPLNCNLCAIYNSRLVLAGGPDWYMSRMNAPTDWDYGADPADPSRAIAGPDTDGGSTPTNITALIPHSNKYLLMGCEESIWVLTGDPGYGGTINAVSHEIGVLGPDAWCSLPDSSTVILSRDGLYLIAGDLSKPPLPISRQTLPAELVNVDWANNLVSMVYDVAARGIHLSITPVADSTNSGTHYFLDWTTHTFWPVKYGANGIQPAAMIRYSTGSGYVSQVILAGIDGYLREFSASATDDDGNAFSAIVVYGPFRIGGPGFYGQIVQIAADLDTSSASLAWEIYMADTPEAAVAAAIAGGATPWSGTFAAGRNSRDYPLAVGLAATIRLIGTPQWAMEGLRIEGERRGPAR